MFSRILLELIELKLWSTAIGGMIVTVDGTYSYHHYMQDNFNDDVSIVKSLLTDTLLKRTPL